jgi:hypothetical protein
MFVCNREAERYIGEWGKINSKHKEGLDSFLKTK